jgi:hypothetical protein
MALEPLELGQQVVKKPEKAEKAESQRAEPEDALEQLSAEERADWLLTGDVPEKQAKEKPAPEAGPLDNLDSEAREEWRKTGALPAKAEKEESREANPEDVEQKRQQAIAALDESIRSTFLNYEEITAAAAYCFAPTSKGQRDFLVDELSGLKHAPQVFQYLVFNPEATRALGMLTKDQARDVLRHWDSQVSPAAKKISTAPAPHNEVGGRGAGARADDEELALGRNDFRNFYKAANRKSAVGKRR